MYKLEENSALCCIIKVYHWVGIWRNESEFDFRRSCIRILYLLQHFSFIVYILISAYDAYQAKDIDLVIYLLGLQISVVLALVKLYYILWRKDDIFNRLKDPIMAHCTEDYGGLMIANQKSSKIAIFIKVYILIISIAVLFVILFPVPIFSGEKMLPLFINFNMESEYAMVFYWIAYLLGSVGCASCEVYSVLMLFIWYIMFNYGIAYKLLGSRFRSLGTKTQNTYQHELIHLIRAHNNLFDTIERFRSCFAPIFFLEITTGAISICMSTYNFSYNTPDNLFEMTFYTVFLLYAIFEIFVTMYLANEITIESDRISHCLFESNWIDQSKSTKVCVTIFGEMIKIPQQLVIFIYPMNLETFTSIVNGAYSMFNILKRFK